MMNFKKILALVLVVALSVSAGILGTVAYLTSEDSDVNTMVLGSVEIQQLEYERVVENGEWVSTGETDKYGYTPDKLQPFTQDKPLYPAVFADGDIKWDDRNGNQNASGDGSHQQSWGQVGASGSNQLFDGSVKNAQDKMVFVKNTGKNGAYVRTWIALEQGDIPADEFKNVIMTNSNKNHWSWEVAATDVEIGGNKYVVWCATYLGPKSNPTGILAPNTVSYPSLLQVYMRPEADNAEVEAIDGNDDGVYNVLVFSQAVQADGFVDATTALTAAFGTEHPWVTEVKNGNSLQNALNAMPVQNVELTENTTATTLAVKAGSELTVKLEDNTLQATYLNNYGDLTVENGTLTAGTAKDYSMIGRPGSVTTFNDVNINAAGGAVAAVDGAKVIFNSGSVTINSTSTSQRYNFYAAGEGAEIIINDGTFSFEAYKQRSYVCAVGGANVVINGGTFGVAPNHPRWTTPFSVDADSTLTIYGGTFGFDPSVWVAEGYVATQNGTTWTVSAQ